MAIDRAKFFREIRVKLFGHLKQGQVDGLTRLLDTWEAYYSKYPIEFLAYCIATSYHETATTMHPIREFGKGRGRKYGVPVGKYRQIYYGRGDVQLTWEFNYVRARKRLKEVFGIDYPLDQNAELALDPFVSSHVLFLGSIEGWFTGKKLGDYLARPKRADDSYNCRRVINGTDKASLIAGYYRIVLNALKPGA